MGMLVNTPRAWRFGVFELDASSGELRRNGAVVPALDGAERRLANSPCWDWVAGRPSWTPDSKAKVMLDQ
jgi:hypothetical protein